jgi:dTDP-4-dehydrorhamnose 3,5-epimerase-like enzyme
MGQLDLSKFENLTLEELRKIATEVGIQFANGNENIKDKEEFLYALDEAYPEELECSYDKMIKNKTNLY